MIAAVADTHTAIWLLFGDPRLSLKARSFIDNAAATQHKIALMPISLAEVVYLVEKERLPTSAFEDLRRALASPTHVLVEIALTGDIVKTMRQIPRASVPDLPDRLVGATVLHLGVPVITRDARIQASNLQAIW